MNNIDNISNIIESLPELAFMPVQQSKQPDFPKLEKNAEGQRIWKGIKKKYDYSGSWGVALLTGAISGNIEVIDVDLKYALDPVQFWHDYLEMINELDPEILPLIVVQRTMSGGFHLIYKCSEIGDSKKLAKRYTTEEEKQKEPKEKEKVLIETKGIHSYIVCYPSPKYTIEQGSLDKIQEITPSQRNTLFEASFSFNEVFKETIQPEPTNNNKGPIPYQGKTPWDDYNERADVVQLLISHGWKFVYEKRDRVHLQRPGSTKAPTSGNYWKEKKWFSTFSPSTEFEAEKAYKPFAVFKLLECHDDKDLAIKKLKEQGYGDSIQSSDYQVFPKNGEMVKPVFNPKSIGSYSFEKWMHDVKNQPPSLKTGIAGLDEKILIPQGAITLIAGRPQHGKTTLLMNLCLSMMEINPGKKFYFFSYEEQARAIALKMLNITINKPILRDFKREPGFEDCKTNLHVLKEYIRLNKVDYTEVEKGLINIKEKLDSGRLNIIDMPLTVEDLAVFISQANQENNIGGIFIDYIQKITTKDPFKDMRLKITHISNFILQEIAKKTGLPIILGAQFNRSAADKEEPRASELKEAGALEEDANLILGLFNEYATFDKKEKTEKGDPVRQRIAINILKNRDGENSIPFDLYLNGQTGRFS